MSTQQKKAGVTPREDRESEAAVVGEHRTYRTPEVVSYTSVRELSREEFFAMPADSGRMEKKIY